jgi:hypothetical protein
MAEKLQTGAWGVLVVQRDLLSLGIDSAPMTTDSGIDLLAYDCKSKRSFSIQVKTSGMALSKTRPDWKIKKNKLNDAELFAFVLKNQKGEAWYLSQADFKRHKRRYNNEYALTFYREGASKRKLAAWRLTERKMKQFEGLGGLEKFLRG